MENKTKQKLDPKIKCRDCPNERAKYDDGSYKSLCQNCSDKKKRRRTGQTDDEIKISPQSTLSTSNINTIDVTEDIVNGGMFVNTNVEMKSMVASESTLSKQITDHMTKVFLELDAYLNQVKEQYERFLNWRIFDLNNFLSLLPPANTVCSKCSKPYKPRCMVDRFHFYHPNMGYICTKCINRDSLISWRSRDENIEQKCPVCFIAKLNNCNHHNISITDMRKYVLNELKEGRITRDDLDDPRFQ